MSASEGKEHGPYPVYGEIAENPDDYRSAEQAARHRGPSQAGVEQEEPQQVGDLLCMDNEWMVPMSPIEETSEDVLEQTGMRPGEATTRKVTGKAAGWMEQVRHIPGVESAVHSMEHAVGWVKGGLEGVRHKADELIHHRKDEHESGHEGAATSSQVHGGQGGEGGEAARKMSESLKEKLGAANDKIRRGEEEAGHAAEAASERVEETFGLGSRHAAKEAGQESTTKEKERGVGGKKEIHTGAGAQGRGGVSDLQSSGGPSERVTESETYKAAGGLKYLQGEVETGVQKTKEAAVNIKDNTTEAVTGAAHALADTARGARDKTVQGVEAVGRGTQEAVMAGAEKTKEAAVSVEDRTTEAARAAAQAVADTARGARDRTAQGVEAVGCRASRMKQSVEDYLRGGAKGQEQHQGREKEVSQRREGEPVKKEGVTEAQTVFETPSVRKYHEQLAEAERAYELAKRRAWGYHQ